MLQANPAFGFDYWQDGDETLLNGFGVWIDVPIETTMGQLLAGSAQLHTVRQMVEDRVTNLTLKGVLTVFEFPPTVKNACEQYLLYFVQFLRDLGIDAEAELREEANSVLFEVTPTDEKQALEQIRAALGVYLQMPSAPEFAAAASQFNDLAVSQLQANVLHLQSQVVLARAVLQMKDATISAQSEALAVLHERLDLRTFLPSNQPATAGDSEPVVAGLVSVKNYSFKFVDVNFPEILRKLKRLRKA